MVSAEVSIGRGQKVVDLAYLFDDEQHDRSHDKGPVHILSSVAGQAIQAHLGSHNPTHTLLGTVALHSVAPALLSSMLEHQ